MKKKELALLAIEKLKERYPEGICSLTYTDPLQLLIATAFRPSAPTHGSIW